MLGALGDGGIITTSDPALDAKLRQLRYMGQTSVKHEHLILGYQERLDELQGALPARQAAPPRGAGGGPSPRRGALPRAARRARRSSCPPTTPSGRHVYYMYTVLAPEREALRAHLDAAGIATQLVYPKLVPDQGAYSDHPWRAADDLSVARSLVPRLLCLPMFAELTDARGRARRRRRSATSTASDERSTVTTGRLGGSGTSTPELMDAIADWPGGDAAPPGAGHRAPGALGARSSMPWPRPAAAAFLRPSVDGVHVTAEPSLDRALEGADIVLVQVRVGGLDARVFDETFPRAFGLPGEETMGPGGFADAVRTVPALADTWDRLATTAPDAFIIDLTNPGGHRYAGGHRAHRAPYRLHLRRAGDVRGGHRRGHRSGWPTTSGSATRA